MRVRFLLLLALLTVGLWTTAKAVVNHGSQAFPEEIEDPETDLPADGDVKAEWAFARLRYPAVPRYYGRRGYLGSGIYYRWGVDSPKAERQFVQGVRRLTRVDARSVEEIISLDNEEVFNWPWLYAVEVGYWNLTDVQCAKLRDYLLRGGFLMTDDFHGTREWEIFMASMKRIFPDREMVDIPDTDPIFHTIYDLDHKVQVAGAQYLYTGRVYEHDGYVPRWRGIYDDRGRLMVGACHNQDNGDAWEWSDRPEYPEKWASQAYRLGIDFLVYSMSH